LEERLKAQLDVIRKDLSITMVDDIFNKFKNYNKTLLSNKDLLWFNDKNSRLVFFWQTNYRKSI